jgi:hypothetical protein
MSDDQSDEVTRQHTRELINCLGEASEHAGIAGFAQLGLVLKRYHDKVEDMTAMAEELYAVIKKRRDTKD